MVAGLLLTMLTAAGSASALNILIPVKAYDFVYDNTHETLLMTVSGSGDVERFDAATQTLLTPISAGIDLSGLDITPDDQFLYVGDRTTVGTEAFVRKVNVTTGATTDLTYTVTAHGGERGVHDIAIANNGKALFSTQYAGSGGVTLRDIDLATGVITARRSTRPYASIDRGIDRSVLFFQDGHIATGPLFTYDASTDSFPAEDFTHSYNGDKPAAVSRDGTQIACINSLMRDDLTVEEILTSSIAGFTFDPLRDILYYADHSTDEIVMYDSALLFELDRFPIGERIDNISRMSISGDTRRIFIRTPSGVRMFDNPMAASSTVPEPSTYIMAGLGLLGLGLLSWRQKLGRTLSTACLCLLAAGPASAANILIPVPAYDFSYDNTRDLLYMTVQNDGAIQRYDAIGQSLLTPFNVGVNLTGLDITADDQYLYVGEGNSGTTQGFVRKIDVDTGIKTNLAYDLERMERGVHDVAIASNGKAFFTTRFAGSGNVLLREIDLATDTISDDHGIRQDTSIDRGVDRSVLFFQQGNSSAGRTFTYDANTDSFPASDSVGTIVGGKPAAVSRDGSQIAFRSEILDDGLNVLDTLSSTIGGHTFDPLRDILYYADYSTEEIVAYDSSGLTELHRIAVGENIGSNSRLGISDDTHRLFIRTPSGVRMIDNPLSANAISSNASYDSSLDVDILNLDFGTVLLQDAVTPIDFDISNLQGVSLTSNLDFVSFSGSGDTTELSTDLMTFPNLGAGGSRTFSAMIDTSTAGSYSATYDLNFTDILGTNQTLTLNISGAVETPAAANASFATGSDVDVLSIDFGQVMIEDVTTPIGFQIFNLLGAGPTADLDLVSIAESGDTATLAHNVTPFTDLVAGNNLTFNASLDTSVAGSFDATYELLFTDLLGTDQTLTFNLIGEVVLPEYPANASFATGSDVNVLDIDFGTFAHNDPAAAIGFQIANLLSPGTAAQLDLVSIVGAGDSLLLTTDLAPFIDLDQGAFLDFNAMFETSVPGDMAAVYELTFTDILGNDQTLMLNLSGEVTITDDPSVPDLIYNAATGEVILDPDGAGGIIGYDLENGSGAFLAGNHVLVLGGVATSLAGNLAEAAFGAITSPASIGNVFPLGMDLTDLYLLLSTNQVSTALGAPLIPFDLFVVGGGPAVPEPSTYAMAGMALVGLGFVGWRRRRKTNRDQIPRLAATISVVFAATFASTAEALTLPTFPGFNVEVYANVTDPIDMTFAPDGTIFVGRDNSGSSGGVGDTVKIHRVSPGGGSVTEYGASALPDPDAILYDTTGAISGIAGTVMVGSGTISGGRIYGIRPDESIVTLFASSAIGNPSRMIFDNTGRMLIANLQPSTRSVLQSTGAPPSALFGLPAYDDRPVDVTVDSLDRIYTRGPNGSVRQYDSAGVLLNGSFSSVPTSSPEANDTGMTFGIGGVWGSDMYAAGDGGDIWMVDSLGATTLVGSGFNDLRDLEFGPDGALYASEFGGDRILRIAPAVPEPSTYAMAALALAGLGLVGWRRRDRRAS